MQSRPRFWRKRCRGIAAMWVLAAGPALLALLAMITESANLWLARVELANALEAGALAGANVWGEAASDTGAARSAARVAARNFVQANTVVGQNLTIDTNDNGSGGNRICPGSIMLGQLDASDLDAVAAAPVPSAQRACRVYMTLQVDSLFGSTFGPWSVQAAATARFDAISGTPRLTRIRTTQCQ